MSLTSAVIKSSSEKYPLASEWCCFVEELLLRFAFSDKGGRLICAALDALDEIDFPVVSGRKHEKE